jgi:hypothetical protein
MTKAVFIAAMILAVLIGYIAGDHIIPVVCGR